jgi:hypothetical protein
MRAMRARDAGRFMRLDVDPRRGGRPRHARSMEIDVRRERWTRAPRGPLEERRLKGGARDGA